MRYNEIDMQHQKEINEAYFTINDRYRPIKADERFYQLVGDYSMYPFNQLVIDEDIENFEDFVENAAVGDSVLIRVKIKDGRVRWYFIDKRGETGEGEDRLVELYIQDVAIACYKVNSYFRMIQKYRAVFNMINNRIFEYDFKTGLFTIYGYINNKSEIFEKDDLQEWKKKVIRLGYVEGDNIQLLETLCNNMEAGLESFSQTIECSIMSRGERKDKLHLKGQTVTDGNDKVMVIGIITELGTRMQEKFVQYDNDDANKDSATGLLNKKTSTDIMTSDINRAAASNYNRKMYLIILDIDNFKQVNDNYGHYFGDEVILSFATALNRAVGNRGVVGRIGGDEFLMLIKDIEDFEDIKILLKSVRNNLKINLAEKQPGYTFTTSIGISTYPDDGKDFETLFKIADGVLYIAKDKGKDRYIKYEVEKHGNLLDKDFKRVHNNGTDFMKPSEKYDLASKLMIQLLKGGVEVAKDVLSTLMDKLNIHGISVFVGDNMKCDYTSGHYPNEIKDAPYLLNKDYLDRFDEHGVNVVNNIEILRMDFPDIFENYNNNNIKSYIQIINGDKKKPKAIIEYDIFGENKRKWSEIDATVIKMVTDAMNSVFNDF